MSDEPIIPLDPQEVIQEEAGAAAEGWLHRSLVAFDIACNVIILRGVEDETISSHSARAAEQGKMWGKLMCRFLNLFQDNHGPKAQAGDIERAKAIEIIEEKSGGIRD